MVAQISLGVLAPLTDALAIIGKPGAGLLDNPGLNAEIDQLTALGYALAIHDIEIYNLEGRCHLVLDDLDAGLIAGNLIAFLDRADTADIEANGGIEFERVTAGRSLRITEHHADLQTNLIDKNNHRTGSGY